MNSFQDLKTKVDSWLNSDTKDVIAGATYLLQLNKNRILHTNLMRKPDSEQTLKKLIYELTKQSELLERKLNFENYRSLTEKDVKEFESKVDKFRKETLPVIKGESSPGKRKDHDSLPAEAIAAYDKNTELYPRMRSVHEKLKLLNTASACDRYPFLKELVEMDEQVRDNWKIYDSASPVETNPKKVIDNESSKTIQQPLDIKIVMAHRAYLSRNKATLLKYKDSDPVKYAKFLAEMQSRYTKLCEGGQSFDEEQINELTELGVIVQDQSKEGQSKEDQPTEDQPTEGQPTDE